MIAMRAKKATLNKRLMGFAMTLLPARTLRTTGTRIKMKAVGKSHIRPNNTIRSVAFYLVMA